MASITNPAAPAVSPGITVQPVAGQIGAEISGLDISQPLDPRSVTVIQQALDTWKVVFFRGQHLDHAAQIAFGRLFGELIEGSRFVSEPVFARAGG
jgi:taurine dioxygenase